MHRPISAATAMRDHDGPSPTRALTINYSQQHRFYWGVDLHARSMFTPGGIGRRLLSSSVGIRVPVLSCSVSSNAPHRRDGPEFEPPSRQAHIVPVEWT